MDITDAQKAMCRELGLSADNNENIKTADGMEYVGFGVYIASDSHVFEKVGSELMEVTTPELQAEIRFINSHKK